MKYLYHRVVWIAFALKVRAVQPLRKILLKDVSELELLSAHLHCSFPPSFPSFISFVLPSFLLSNCFSLPPFCPLITLSRFPPSVPLPSQPSLRSSSLPPSQSPLSSPLPFNSTFTPLNFSFSLSFPPYSLLSFSFLLSFSSSLPSSFSLPLSLPPPFFSLPLPIHPIPPSPLFNFSFPLFLRPSLSSSLPSRYPESLAFHTLVKDMFFSAMQLANMGYEHKIFRQMLKLICSLLLNKTLKQAFSCNSVLKN